MSAGPAAQMPSAGSGPVAPVLPAAPRLARLDALRGLAIVWMMAFHFSFDLNWFGWLSPAQNFNSDPFWTWQRTAIVSLFLLCAGMSQACALHVGQAWPQFWRRWGQVALCALLVSVGSALMFPKSWISFGVLHGMAVMLLLLRLLAPLPGPALLGMAALCLALPHGLSHPFFDTRWTNWLGLVTRKPITEDYVPVLPWIGVMLLGLVLGRMLVRRGGGLLAGHLPPGTRVFAWLGRWPLSVYMLHQPLFIGLLWLASTMLR
jgi:uncharacterized membrane protein